MSNLTEDQTRITLIDPLLKEVGFQLNKEKDREYEVSGMPNGKGIGFVDYVLWGDDGLPLAVVEAKKTIKDPRVGQQQAKLYADCLENEFNRRPLIYYTNGYEHWFWDNLNYPPRRVQGFHKKDELELMMQRRTDRLPLAGVKINKEIAGRPYQEQAIRSVTESMEKENRRRNLLVMATGTGKTRVAIALSDLLMHCNWAKRVLFLADRRPLVKQATAAFTNHLPNVGVVNLLINPDSQGRIYVSTYQTILNQINKTDGEKRKFGIGHFDLVIIDEAHRSVYNRYRSIFSYFDSYLLGLTATPRDEIDRNTYSLFQTETGMPTYAYGLEEAISQGFLSPPRAVSVPLKCQREGIKYEELTEDEKEQWDELEWGEDGPPEEVDSKAINSWLFNQDTVDKVLRDLMTNGQKVASGDRIGKTIIFAKNVLHAEYIAERFDINYPNHKGDLARVITHDASYAQDLLDKFSIKEKSPHIAISVDMLDTGIDVPEIVNLVFFKIVRSKTKFWQMMGRGTRLCENLYSPQKDKKFFYVFDYCQNLEYFAANLGSTDGSNNESLGTKIFKKRIEILEALQSKKNPITTDEKELQKNMTSELHELVSNMTVDNVIVRAKRRFVEKYKDISSWSETGITKYDEISRELSNLPSQKTDPDEEAKHFDFIISKLQLCLLNNEKKGFIKLQNNVRKIASALELKDSIPAVRSKMPLIQEIATDLWWENINIGNLEHIRKQLRSLIRLIDKTERNIIYTNFEDTLGESEEINLNLNVGTLDFEEFKKKTRAFINEHKDKLVINKLCRNTPVTETDLKELEKILLQLADDNAELINRAKENSEGLGLFVRSLVGLERIAATEALSEFLNDKTATSSQINFLNLIVEELTKNGAIKDDRLYESPFVDITPTGPESIFDQDQVNKLFTKIEEIRLRAIA